MSIFFRLLSGGGVYLRRQPIICCFYFVVVVASCCAFSSREFLSREPIGRRPAINHVLWLVTIFNHFLCI